MTRRWGLARLYEDRPGFEIVANSQGAFVHYSDYEELRTRLESLIRWCRRVDPYSLSDEALSDYDEDLREIEEFLKEVKP